jgi:hypothetical protein
VEFRQRPSGAGLRKKLTQLWVFWRAFPARRCPGCCADGALTALGCQPTEPGIKPMGYPRAATPRHRQ